MAYRNGRDALPPDLLRMVQKYAAGDCLYIPCGAIAPAPRRQDPALAERNRSIRDAYRNGKTVKELSHQYFLSTQSIYKILHQE